jgi:hypothetical protein
MFSFTSQSSGSSMQHSHQARIDPASSYDLGKASEELCHNGHPCFRTLRYIPGQRKPLFSSLLRPLRTQFFSFFLSPPPTESPRHTIRAITTQQEDRHRHRHRHQKPILTIVPNERSHTIPTLDEDQYPLIRSGGRACGDVGGDSEAERTCEMGVFLNGRRYWEDLRI